MLEEYKKVYQMLEDEESRDIYLNRLNYLISGDYKYIQNIVTAYLPYFSPLNGKNLNDLWKLVPKGRKVVLYGAGVVGRELLNTWEKDERFIGFCCKTEEKQLNGYLGYPVMSPKELLARQDLSVIVSTVNARDEIVQILRNGNYPEDQIFVLNGYYKEFASDPYFSLPFFQYEINEIFVDAGCYDLASSLDFKKNCQLVKKVYAFEPDPENYQLCLERKEETGFSQVSIFPYGTWSERKTLHFCAGAFCSSKISEDGKQSISVMPIDEAIEPSDRVTFIKMDVEGAELESLKGARKTILRDKPKLAICIYHKPEDMIEIPLYVKELVPEYKLFVRHHSNTSSETILYAVIP